MAGASSRAFKGTSGTVRELVSLFETAKEKGNVRPLRCTHRPRSWPATNTPAPTRLPCQVEQQKGSSCSCIPARPSDLSPNRKPLNRECNQQLQLQQQQTPAPRRLPCQRVQQKGSSCSCMPARPSVPSPRRKPLDRECNQQLQLQQQQTRQHYARQELELQQPAVLVEQHHLCQKLPHKLQNRSECQQRQQPVKPNEQQRTMAAQLHVSKLQRARFEFKRQKMLSQFTQDTMDSKASLPLAWQELLLELHMARIWTTNLPENEVQPASHASLPPRHLVCA